MNMVGSNSNRISRMSTSRPACETRWIVPARPYTPPKGAMERVENMILMGAGVVAVVCTMAVMIASEMM